MNSKRRGIYQTAIFILILFLMIRLFPLAVRFIEASAMGIRQFWTVMLVIALTGWAVWFFRKRKLK